MTPPVQLALPPVVAVDQGCVHCQWCVTLMPQVFAMQGDHAYVRTDAVDGQQRLKADLLAEEDVRFLDFVADGCPAKVIRVDR